MHVYVESPPASTQTAADMITTEVGTQLTSKEFGLYRFLSSTSHTVTIYEAGVPNTVSSDRVMLVPTTADCVIADASSERASTSEGLDATPTRKMNRRTRLWII